MRLFPLASTLFVLAGLTLATPGHAQPAPGAPAAPAVSPEIAAAMKQARAMTDTLNVPLQTRNLLTSMRNQLVQATVQASGKSIDDAIKIVDEVLMPDFNTALPELSDIMLQPWANNFSAAELKQLQDFYNTPLGQHVLKVVPTVGQQVAQGSQAWGQRIFQQAIKTHADELHARGLKF
jgi:hypothetical protein